MRVPIPQFLKHCDARCAESFVVVPVPLVLKRNVEVENLAFQEQVFEKTCEQILKVPVPEVTERFVARLVNRRVPRRLKGS